MLSKEQPRSHRQRWKIWMYGIGGALLTLYLAALILLIAFEQRIIFLPPTSFPATQVSEIGPDVEDLKVPVDLKTYLHAWWIPGLKPGAPTILFFDGNAGVLQRDAKQQVTLFRQTGANLLLIDYRGYGTSSPFQTSAASTRKDALAAFQYLERDRHIPAKKIVIFGWSIGTGVATQLALDEPHAGGLILLSPITSVSDVGNNASWLFRYLLRPAQWLRHDNDFANKNKIASIHIPVLLMVGTNDTLASPWMAKQLFALANEPKSLDLLKGAGHANAMSKRPADFVMDLKNFLGSLQKQPAIDSQTG